MEKEPPVFLGLREEAEKENGAQIKEEEVEQGVSPVGQGKTFLSCPRIWRRVHDQGQDQDQGWPGMQEGLSLEPAAERQG